MNRFVDFNRSENISGILNTIVNRLDFLTNSQHFRNMKLRWIIFTDLDGTLLDSQTYDFTPALPALNQLQKTGVPVVPCTSKTHLEVIRLREKLGLRDPFIVENGSAIFMEPEYFPLKKDWKTLDGYHVKILGKTYDQIREFFLKLRTQFSLLTKGFFEMSVKEIQAHTQLNYEEAALAKQRFFSEPFVNEEQFDLLSNKEVVEFVEQHGFRLLKGNRFYHLIGQCDKGLAVKELINVFKEHWQQPVKTLGLGDSRNDVELLKAVDVPVLIRKFDGSYLQEHGLESVFVTENIGPAGWAEAVNHFVLSAQLKLQ